MTTPQHVVAAAVALVTERPAPTRAEAQELGG
jgi:hypothetical protein